MTVNVRTLNRVKQSTGTTGTGTVTLGSAASGYLTAAEAGIANGDVVTYVIEEGSDFEIGYGTYSTTGPTISRDNVEVSKISGTSGTSKMNLAGAASIALVPIAKGLARPMTVGPRLTLQSGTPVMTTTQSAKTTIYCTPYIHQHVPLWDGYGFYLADIGAELSQATTDTTKSPAAVGTFGSATNVPACYDVFVWDDAGTKRATRGPGWSSSATVTMTIATPCVVTWTNHGLSDGFPVWFTTTGALPTGISANTVYYVTKVDANSFKLSTTLANQVATPPVFVATSGSQSGTHTATNNTTARGAGAGTSELQLLNGIYVNKNAITNGPGANYGFFLGTVLSNASSSIDWILGAVASGGTAAMLNVWNAYNRVLFGTAVGDTATSYTYNTTGTWRAANQSANMRVNFVRGLAEDAVISLYNTLGDTNTAGNSGGIANGLNATQGISGATGFVNVTSSVAMIAGYNGIPPIGGNYISALEYIDTGTLTIRPKPASNFLQGLLEVTLRA